MPEQGTIVIALDHQVSLHVLLEAGPVRFLFVLYGMFALTQEAVPGSKHQCELPAGPLP